MKTTLTSADPSGWYLCQVNFNGSEQVRYWDGKRVCMYPGSACDLRYTNFRRLFTESDVAALNEELRTLREELATSKHSLDVCSKYAESMQRSSEDYLNELRKEREENATLQNQADSLLKQAEQLEAELSRLKSQPYEMRRADTPDCVGLWKSANGFYYECSSERCLEGNWLSSPYHYLGPIPVVVEQQPPKVVNVRWISTGAIYRAIPCMAWGKVAAYMLLGNDGSGSPEFTKPDMVEEVQ